jgi:hypothetical protein
LAILLTLTLAACSGSSGGSGGGSDPDGSNAPGLSLSASPTSVSPGGFTTLTWSATRATSCEASGAWSGSRAVSGSQQVGPINSEQQYRMSCSGSGGGVSRQVTVSLSGGSPTISLQAEPQQIAEGDSSTLTWSVTGATSCTANGGWSGSRPLSGTFGTGPLTSTTSFGLSCSGDGGNALQSVSVEVLDKWLRWQAPTQNVDGTPITDLAGYVVYWGTQSGSYTGNHRIDDPAVTEWEADIAPGDYYFALTAFDAAGNESDYSNEVRKRIL